MAPAELSRPAVGDCVSSQERAEASTSVTDLGGLPWPVPSVPRALYFLPSCVGTTSCLQIPDADTGSFAGERCTFRGSF